MFGDGSQGALNVTSGITYLPLNTKLQYTTVNVGASGTIRPSGTTGSVLYICATESITINGTINTSDIVNYGNNTWGVTIDGQSFTSPGVANGGNGQYYAGTTQALQSAGFGGGGSGSSVTFLGTNYRSGNGGNGSSSPSGGSAISVSLSANGTSANRRDAAGTNGGSGVAVAYRSGASASGSTSATGGSGGQGYGGNGAAGSGSNSGSSSGSWSYYWYGGGGGGAGGRAGRAGIHVVLKSPTVIINGTINTSGTNGTNGGNGGRDRNWSSWQDYWGMPGGGGGGGNAGEIQVTYNTTFTDSGTYLQTGGSGGSGGSGGQNNAEIGFSGTNGSANGLTSTITQPIADFTSNVTSGVRPLTVNFTNKSSGGDTYLWNFGDSNTSTAENPTKVYSSVGTYTVSLTATNAAGSVTATKTAYITTTVETFSMSIDGTIKFSGGANRQFLASRSISGTLLFSGGARAVVIRDAEALKDKRYLYKVYDEDGIFIDIWKDVVSELSFTHEINSIGSTTSIKLARNSDTVGTVSSNLLTESNQNILAEDDLPLLAVTESKNQIGPGSSVDYNNRVDIYAFYGSTGPLQTEDYESIITEDDEEILADLGHPNGIRVFTGFISEINSRYGNTETTIVQLSSYGWDTDQFPLMKSGATTVTYNSYDPSDIAKDAIDQFVIDSSSYGTYTHRDSISIATSGTTVSYTFKSNTYKEVMDKVLELLPSNWYYRVGLGDNIVYYSSRSSTADHLFYLGKHIKALDLKGSILDVVNRVLFTGGGDPALYLDRSEAPADRTRRALKVMSDNRVTLTDSAEIIIDSNIDQNNKTQYRTTIEILSSVYDIESINVGQTIGFRNFGNYVDALTMQVVGLSYTPESVQLQLETKPPTINKRLEDIRRQLTVSENQNLPTTPS